ncbi:MAG: ABC transporter transmembrane domain-containing protein, partial [Hyphomicrobiales bacterium]
MTSPAPAEDRKSRSLRPLLALAPFALRYKGRIALAFLALVAASAATLSVPIAIRRMIDHGFSAENADFIDSYFLMMVVIAAVLAVASSCRYYLVMTLGERVVADLRTAVFNHLTTLSASFYDSAKIGEIVSRLTADTTQIKSVFGASASQALRN